MRYSITAVLAVALLVAAGEIHAGEIHTSHAFGSQLGTINTATAAGTNIGPYNFGMFQAQTAFDANGGLHTLGIFDFPTNIKTQLATVDISTGAATAVGAPMDGFLSALEIDSRNTGYAIRYVDDSLPIGGVPTFYTMDITTAQLTAVGNSEIERAMDTAIDSKGNLWVVGGADGNRLYTVNPRTGASKFEAEVMGVAAATGIADAEIMGIMFNEEDVLYGTSFVANSPLFTIDTSTGATTVVGSTGFDFPHGGDIYNPPVLPPGMIGNPGIDNSGLDGQLPSGLRDGLPLTSRHHAVPEPASATLILLGCSICLFTKRHLAR